MIRIKDRRFPTISASITGSFINNNLHCSIEADFEGRVFDDETWSPGLIHNGLVLPVASWEELQGLKVEWMDSSDKDYHHPEIGILYVFGHEETKSNMLSFGSIKGGRIQVTWEGVNDICWDDDYGDDVPFFFDSEIEFRNA